MSPALLHLNTAPPQIALSLMAPLVERSPWVAQAALAARPFASDEALSQALVEVILRAGPDRRLALFNAHPELAGHEALAGSMTAHSMTEQGRLGLTHLTGTEAARLAQMNAQYHATFGHPFIIALHRVADRAALFDTFAQRLTASPLEEHTTTLAEIASVIRARTRHAFGGETLPPSHEPQEL